ncbi:Fpg/Nei family DNA glycosylase [Aurantiacibacter sediminis]|uniref:Fpg/Nei family DNA glycosylase n=1 Tax=Aurantiacibacter sediminis TaxID=2793064 RepID=A0ABS0N4M4_9SPHN|nr:Fpg/Nei family DNA glycosylase [Aurantiacibacter sediminis]MBH5322465.1 Fpg/Nei family DNA glycosylase [Aurantiacibacter sediminis]
MPELPEAEHYRRTIAEKCLNRTIESVELGDDTEHVELPGGNARERLVGHQFTETHRHGKLIFAGSKDGPWICVHLGMTGRLLAYDTSDHTPPDFNRILIAFEGERRLAFSCPRKLGWVHVLDDPEDEIAERGFGPDAMDISEDDFVEVIGSTNGAIKGALMAQKKLAGIGNLWSDEILFQSELHPETKASDLDEKTLRKMHAAMRRILAGVCDKDADYSQLPYRWLVSHRHKGEDCRRCDGTITKSKVSGRSAYHCDSVSKPG